MRPEVTKSSDQDRQFQWCGCQALTDGHLPTRKGPRLVLNESPICPSTEWQVHTGEVQGSIPCAPTSLRSRSEGRLPRRSHRRRRAFRHASFGSARHVPSLRQLRLGKPSQSMTTAGCGQRVKATARASSRRRQQPDRSVDRTGSAEEPPHNQFVIDGDGAGDATDARQNRRS